MTVIVPGNGFSVVGLSGMGDGACSGDTAVLVSVLKGEETLRLAHTTPVRTDIHQQSNKDSNTTKMILHNCTGTSITSNLLLCPVTDNTYYTEVKGRGKVAYSAVVKIL